MVDEGLFIPDDPFQRASFIALFLPILQEVVDEYVGVWSSHLVRQINENGRYRLSHVPTRYFREFERLHSEINSPKLPIQNSNIQQTVAKIFNNQNTKF